MRIESNSSTESDELIVTIADPQPDGDQERGCNTKFNGLDGEYGKSASLWLADMERHREKGSSPSMYLQHIDRHLEGEAARWVLNTPSVRVLIYKGYMELATESEIDAFGRALSDRFKLTYGEARDFLESTPLWRLIMLEQESSEGLEQYYKRTRELLLAVHGRDGENGTLTPPEISLRTMVVELFALGFSNQMLRRRGYQQHIYHRTVSLHQAFKMAEAEMKTMEVEAQSADSEKKEQEEKKRKLATDSEEENKVKRQKHMIVKVKLPATTSTSTTTTTTTKEDGSAGRAEQAAKDRRRSHQSNHSS